MIALALVVVIFADRNSVHPLYSRVTIYVFTTTVTVTDSEQFLSPLQGSLYSGHFITPGFRPRTFGPGTPPWAEVVPRLCRGTRGGPSDLSRLHPGFGVGIANGIGIGEKLEVRSLRPKLKCEMGDFRSSVRTSNISHLRSYFPNSTPPSFPLYDPTIGRWPH